mmetsp:Transcript_13387/g.32798  ORF Transcript_13387/g.32798 Transcript_13387/m.32798 type:complete len:861 (-) Transcript_13387:994-3576(-)|eukprot:CAMPEP_0178990866 /NCGR_PEP_ID=MMETSP0795-20121207/5203_1 /TAXON_ID=88552 /ORGANISM="Amoebophrya sp., Strain Ameob2" /LENGTH=860 /DNA_ID=CAMNT_0020682497 /DNA_START=332 /DNA_END=2914 /DNA_ORIENTATION=-
MASITGGNSNFTNNSSNAIAAGGLQLVHSTLRLPGDGEDLHHVITVVPPPRSPVGRVDPVNDMSNKKHLILLVDVSGSMGSRVQAVAESGAKEDHGFSILDLVKHSLLTVVNSLDAKEEGFCLSLVAFTSSAKIVFERLEVGKEADKKKATKEIEQLTPLNSTNLWDGLKTAVDVMVQTGHQNENQRDQEFDDSASTISTSSDVASTVATTQEPDAEPPMTTAPPAARGGEDKIGYKFASDFAKTEVWLFTDGLPNQMNTPQGHVGALQKYLKSKKLTPGTDFTLRTFGFGYSLESKLLDELALLGMGSFCFIPDGSFVGTVFIHALASLRNTCVNECKDLKISVRGGGPGVVSGGPSCVSEVKVKGGLHGVCVRDSEICIPLGNVLEYGQPRDIVLLEKMKRTPAPVTAMTSNLEVSASFVKTGCGEMTLAALPENHSHTSTSTSSARLLRAIFRAEGVEVLDFLVNKGLLPFGQERNVGFGGSSTNANQQNLPSLEEKTAKVDALLQKFAGSLMSDDPTTALAEDFRGQVLEAVSRQDWFNKWGAYYLRSLRFAHMLQKRNNFKDVGVQNYGENTVFDELVDEITDVFVNKVETPKPSREGGRGGRGGPPISMSAYNNSYGPCWSADAKVLLADGKGTLRRCDEMKAGDLVLSGLKQTPMRVKCVIETVSANNALKLIRFGKELNGLGITPWHPVYFHHADLQVGGTSVHSTTPAENDEMKSWHFPAEIVKQQRILGSAAAHSNLHHVRAVYNFLLEAVADGNEEDHTISVNGVTTCTLGHGIENDPVVSHAYFGSWARVAADLAEMEGFSAGKVVLNVADGGQNCCVKTVGRNGEAEVARMVQGVPAEDQRKEVLAQ